MRDLEASNYRAILVSDIETAIQFARACGDTEVATSLSVSLDLARESWARSRARPREVALDARSGM